MTDAEIPGRILIVDDDAAVAWALGQALEAEGYVVTVAADAAAARRQIARQRPDTVLTDVRMPGESGLDLLADLHRSHPQLPVLVMTAHGTVETAIAAVQRGAFDYLVKPLDLDRTCALVKRAMGEDRLALTTGTGSSTDSAIIGSTPAMQDLYRRLAAAAATDLAVLVTGSSGTGKELVARALHRHSRRSGGPFIAVNCGALPDHLVESELFGHEAGAFTDAKARRIGRFEAAQHGTLFLDEIGELPAAAQVKLLRFLEDQRIVRLGGEEELALDVRVVAATNRDLQGMIASGGFRADLGYRLRVIQLTLPALADRLDDLPALAKHFLARCAQRLGRELAITDAAMALLTRHPWPGNVRELKHVLEEAAVMATGGIIAPEHLRIQTAGTEVVPTGGDFAQAVQRLAARLLHLHPGEVHARLTDAMEESLLREVLARTQGNQLRAAELLGINRITLKKRMDQLGLGR